MMPRACLFLVVLLLTAFHVDASMAGDVSGTEIRDATSTFEVGIQIRAWTIRDEGMNAILDNMQSMCGVNNLYMVVVMHQEHRPFKAPEFPHNPVRDVWDAEDSRVTFFPDMERYGVIKPRLSDVSWIRETDWLRLMVDSCRERGLKVGAEVSHFPIPKELIKRGIKAALDSPAKIDGLVLKHYDGASFSHMRAFKQGMIEAGVKGLRPIIGKEVEEMELDNYAPIEGEFVEEWGVETQGTGTASFSFDDSSGAYDIKITYFDEDDGQGRVTLLVAGKKKASFKLDEDTDCWRWRLFENIRVNHGDEIKLVGQADKREQTRLDFIEFVPRKRN